MNGETRFRKTIPGPGGELRFAVGSPDGPRSARWKLWAPPHKNDVYLAYRAAGRYVKVSLHQSGDWRFQFISADIARAVGAADGTRLIQQWQRPPADEGWTIGPMIVVPEKDVVPLALDEPMGDVIWFPPPTAGHGVWIHVFIIEPNISGKTFAAATPGGGFSLANGEVCLVIARYRALSEEDELWLEAQRQDWEPTNDAGVEEGQAYARVLTFRNAPRLPPMFFDLAIRAEGPRSGS